MKRLLALLLLTLLPATVATAQTDRVVGSFVSWSIYRNYHVPDIPVSQVTHINYNYATVVNGQCVLSDPWADIFAPYPGDVPGQPYAGSFNQLNLLKAANPQLKTLITVGGWTHSSGFSAAVATAADRMTFAASCVQFMVDYDFDGIDIDWEFPVTGGLTPGTPADTQNLTLFMQELRSQLDAREVLDSRDYLLTMTAHVVPASIQYYELSLLHPIVDWINMLTYNFHGDWSPMTNHMSPLYPVTNGPMGFNDWNIDSALATYVAAGVPTAKLNMGIPFFGRGYSMVSIGTTNGLYEPFAGVPTGTWVSGVYDYSDIVENIVTPATRNWDSEAMVPWYYDNSSGILISYDDVESITEKLNYTLANNLGGVMFTEFSGDDDMHTLVDLIYDMILGPPPGPRFQRLDASNDGAINLGDVVYLLGALFIAGSAPLECDDAGDTDDSGTLNIGDAVFALNYLFSPTGGPLPEPVNCGVDPTPDTLDCMASICP